QIEKHVNHLFRSGNRLDVEIAPVWKKMLHTAANGIKVRCARHRDELANSAPFFVFHHQNGSQGYAID
ncbi:MAG: hypothetical protein ACREQC_08750, partial [Candidatus Binataceae bacterium]